MSGVADNRLRGRGLFLGFAVFVGAMALVAGVFYVAQSQRDFELARWQAKLQSSGAQPAIKVEQWLADSRDQLHAVAVNPTVQIYLAQAAAAGAMSQPTPDAQAQAIFLAGYISSLGQHGAFASTVGLQNGLAVLDAHRHLLASTTGYRPSPVLVARLAALMKVGEAGPASTRSTVAFMTAVRPMQGALNAAPIGYVVGERSLDAAFWAADGSAVGSDGGEESLIALDNPGQASLVASSAGAAKRSASAGELRAALQMGRLQRGRDFQGRPALNLGVNVSSAPWVLVESVPEETALAGVDAKIRSLVFMLLLGILAIIAAILALWRHTAGLRAVELREESVKLYRGVVELLLQAIDQRDPGAAAHSRRVAALSRAMAVNLGASAQEADTAELAGALLNVGKLFVPAGLLTKTGPLDAAERRDLAAGSARWLDLLAGLPMDPPLEPILRAAQSLAQGDPEAGAPQLAYIIMVANSAIALMSRRAYRPAYSKAEALELLTSNSLTVPSFVLGALREVFVSAAQNG